MIPTFPEIRRGSLMRIPLIMPKIIYATSITLMKVAIHGEFSMNDLGGKHLDQLMALTTESSLSVNKSSLIRL